MPTCSKCGWTGESADGRCGTCGAKLAEAGSGESKPPALCWYDWLECLLLFLAGAAGIAIAVFLFSWAGLFPPDWNAPIGWIALLGGLAAVVSAFRLLNPYRSRRQRNILALVFLVILPLALWGMFILRGD